MEFVIIVNGAPHASPAARSAHAFTAAALARGHDVQRVFFYHDGVFAANGHAVVPQDEWDAAGAWRRLADEHGIELTVCIAAALKRGVANTAEAERYGIDGANLATGFTIVGLGQLADALISSDRAITFAS